MKNVLTPGLLTAVLALPVNAGEFDQAISNYYQSDISAWASAQVLVDAINAQNEVTAAYDAARIDALDKAWRAEIGQSDTPTITPVLSSEAAAFLRDQVAASSGRVTEIFIMDAQGLNVAASGITSDYWQGDEEKHSETYGIGPGGFHISEIELDESTQRYQGQVSFTIVDPSTGRAIGAMTVGLDAESLM